MSQPTLGRIVHYTLSEYDATLIDQQSPQVVDGRQVRNAVRAGSVLAARIVQAWGDSPGSAVNLKVDLDGEGEYWATSRQEGEGEGRWTAHSEPPSLGGDVLYRGKQGLLAMRAAKVTGTVDSLDPRGVEAGQVRALDSDQHVHLWVFTPGESGGFAEFNVAPGGEPGQWSWPPRA